MASSALLLLLPLLLGVPKIPDADVESDMQAVDSAIQNVKLWSDPRNSLAPLEANLTEAQVALLKRHWELETISKDKPEAPKQFSLDLFGEALDLLVEMNEEEKAVKLRMDRLDKWADGEEETRRTLEQPEQKDTAVQVSRNNEAEQNGAAAKEPFVVVEEGGQEQKVESEQTAPTLTQMENVPNRVEISSEKDSVEEKGSVLPVQEGAEPDVLVTFVEENGTSKEDDDEDVSNEGTQTIFGRLMPTPFEESEDINSKEAFGEMVAQMGTPKARADPSGEEVEPSQVTRVTVPVDRVEERPKHQDDSVFYTRSGGPLGFLANLLFGGRGGGRRKREAMLVALNAANMENKGANNGTVHTFMGHIQTKDSDTGESSKLDILDMTLDDANSTGEKAVDEQQQMQSVAKGVTQSGKAVKSVAAEVVEEGGKGEVAADQTQAGQKGETDGKNGENKPKEEDEQKWAIKQYLEQCVAKAASGPKKEEKLAYDWYAELLYWSAKWVEVLENRVNGVHPELIQKFMLSETGIAGFKELKGELTRCEKKLSALKEWIGEYYKK